LVESETLTDPDLRPIVLELLRNASQDGTADQDSRLGTRFGRYEVTSKLGRGGMGHVYAARDVELGRMVALKFLDASEMGAPSVAERLVQEAKAASALNHPNIVTVYDVVRQNDEIALTMELVEGQSLREHCQSPQPAGRVAQWGRQVASALAATHRRGIVHRDIKPENIMLRPDGRVKVLDFSLARQIWTDSTGSSTSGLLAGTLQYMSPEQTRGDVPTAASDVFALGIVLFELLCGRHPFDAPSPIDTAHAIAHADPQPLPADFPREMASLLHAMLAKDPLRRPASADVEHRIARWSDSSTAIKNRGPWRMLTGLAGLFGAGWLLWTLVSSSWFQPKPVVLEPVKQWLETSVTAAALSPDGKLLAYAPVGGPVSIRRLADRQIRKTSEPVKVRMSRIAWFSDQKHLLISGIADWDQAPHVWMLAMEDTIDRPVLLPAKGRDATPSPDGARIALTSADGALIWIADRNGAIQRILREAPPNTTYSSLVWSVDGARVSYMVLRASPSPELSLQQSFETVAVDSGRVVAHVDNLPMYSGTALPDGRILCLPWAYPASSHGGALIEIRTDPNTGTFLGQSRRPMPYVEDGLYSSFSASRDGSVMALVAASSFINLYVADLKNESGKLSLANTRRLTFEESEDYPHAWNRDSNAVYFESNRRGNYDLFRLRLDQREPEALYASPEDEQLPHLTPDGNWILFRKSGLAPNAILMRMPSGGGKPEPVPVDGKTSEEFRCGSRTNSRCVIRSKENRQFVFRELDAVKGKGRVLARTVIAALLIFDWDLSPDGTMLAIPNHDPQAAQIRLVPLGGAAGADEQLIQIPGMRNLSSVAWSADGKGLFVSAVTVTGGVMVYSDLAGNIQPLLESARATFAVPSPDGRRIVFPERVHSNSVQLLRTP
jgi:Tol biopolymer transport system component